MKLTYCVPRKFCPILCSNIHWVKTFWADSKNSCALLTLSRFYGNCSQNVSFTSRPTKTRKLHADSELRFKMETLHVVFLNAKRVVVLKIENSRLRRGLVIFCRSKKR